MGDATATAAIQQAPIASLFSLEGFAHLHNIQVAARSCLHQSRLAILKRSPEPESAHGIKQGGIAPAAPCNSHQAHALRTSHTASAASAPAPTTQVRKMS